MSKYGAPFDAMLEACVKDYGEKAGSFLAKRIATAIRRTKAADNCLDNLRWADKANAREVEEYERQLGRGCCGFFDDEVTYFPTSQTFRFGFNYGH